MSNVTSQSAFSIDVIGVGADGIQGLPPAARDAVATAEVLVGGKRHLALAENPSAEQIPITGDMGALVEKIGQKAASRRVVVLASGDPLFFGFGKRLAATLGADRLRFHPALSAVQLVAARAGIPWEDAVLASVHGREMGPGLASAAGAAKAVVLTADGEAPRAVAGFLLARGYEDYAAWVGEDLGAAEERITHLDIRELAAREKPFAALNTLLLVRQGERGTRAQTWRQRVPGIADEEFFQRKPEKGLITKREIRVAALARLGLQAVGTADVWDLGAGSGSVAVEIALACPAARVLAFEKNDEECANIRANAEKFGTCNLRLIQGRAPETIPADSRPAAVFLGGSGGELTELVRLSWERLLPGGAVVAAFATIENLAEAMTAFKSAGAAPELAQYAVARGKPLLDMTRLDPLNPVFILSASKTA